MRPRRHSLVVMAGALAAVPLAICGCPTPAQYGGPIPIDPDGMQERIAWLCGLGQSNADVTSICTAEEPVAAVAASAAAPAASTAPPSAPSGAASPAFESGSGAAAPSHAPLAPTGGSLSPALTDSATPLLLR